MRFAIFHAILLIIVLWRFVLPMRATPLVKGLLTAFLVCAAAYPFVTAVFLGGLLSPELPSGLMVAGSLASSTLLVLAVFTVMREGVIFIAVLAGRSGVKLHKAVQQDRRSVLALGAASVGVAAFGVWQGVKVPDVVRRDLRVPNLPPELEGFTFVHLSDVHCSSLLSRTHMEALVERVNALSPELILITGDIADGTVKARLEDAAPLADLRARLGVFGCDGNHEHYLDYDRWVEHYAALGIRMLRNEHVVLEPRQGVRFALGGVCDPHAARFGREAPDADRTFAGAPEGLFRILMAHQPKRFPEYRQETAFDLQLSGHTHGGQVVGMQKAVEIMNGMFVKGLYALPDGTRMYVHPGSGLWNGFVLRLGVPAEIAVHRLVRAA